MAKCWLLVLFLTLLTSSTQMGCTGQDFLGSAGFDVSGNFVGQMTRSPLVYAPADTMSLPCTIVLKMTGDSVDGTITTGSTPIVDQIKITDNILTGRVVSYYEGLANVDAVCYEPQLSYAQAKNLGILRRVVLRVTANDFVVQGDIIPDTSQVYSFSLLLKKQ